MSDTLVLTPRRAQLRFSTAPDNLSLKAGLRPKTPDSLLPRSGANLFTPGASRVTPALETATEYVRKSGVKWLACTAK
jgi:hypothetical protein